MRTVMADAPPEATAWLERRRALGQDRRDEVWEGEYHVAPAAHSSHGYVVPRIQRVLEPYADRSGLTPIGEFNLGEPDDYRVPDSGWTRGEVLATYVPTVAIVVEVLSPRDDTWQKFDFYFARDVEEILVVDPAARSVRWFVRGEQAFEPSPGSRLLGVEAGEVEQRTTWPGGD